MITTRPELIGAGGIFGMVSGAAMAVEQLDGNSVVPLAIFFTGIAAAVVFTWRVANERSTTNAEIARLRRQSKANRRLIKKIAHKLGEGVMAEEGDYDDEDEDR